MHLAQQYFLIDELEVRRVEVQEILHFRPERLFLDHFFEENEPLGELDFPSPFRFLFLEI